MPWIDTTLDTSFGKVISSAQDNLTAASTKLAGINNQIGKVTSTLNNVLDSLTLNQDSIGACAQAGFYFIILSVDTGGWNNRLADALNSPPNIGFSAGFANIIVSPDPTGLAAQLGLMVKALTKPFNLPSILTTNNPAEGYVPIVPSISLEPFDPPEPPDLSGTDVWVETSVGGIFSASLSGLIQDNNLAIKEAKSVLDLANQLGQRVASFQYGLNSINDFISQLGSAGVYNIILPPFAGGYLTRLMTEVGAPPTDPSYYSCGIACIAEASLDVGMFELNTQYQSLRKLL